MMTSKWVIHRIGLIDFWYYDEEEFYFRDGRLLLRGANGSGKSVTMQSFIPLLLDGNKAAERLDPFGTKARRLENYLLEENDKREERTGYLFMEFKRKESDTYVTIGIGLCAKRNKKLDSWHFILRDGRRIGHDFFLYKDLKNKITLSKVELTNRLGDGGQVIEGQGEYMKLVNDTLFGYENVEEYKELVDLLIQLRTPKLSKDFKPTILNEILSNSLPPLSDDDLRPMSEAIENMDNLKTRLRELEAGKKAADKIYEVYQSYNKALLTEKARQYLEILSEYQQLQQELRETASKIEESKDLYQQALAQEERLGIEETTLKQKKENLDQSDLSKLMSQKLEAEQRLAQLAQELKSKEQSLGDRTEKEVELRHQTVSIESKLELQENSIRELLEEMGEQLEFLSFDEHEFMSEELRKNIEKEYSFLSLRNQMSQMKNLIDLGIGILERKQQIEEKQEEAQIDLERTNLEKQKAVRQQELLEEQCRELKSEWQERFYQWSRNNALLKLSEQQESYFVNHILSYGKDTDPFEAKEQLRKEKDKAFAGYQRQEIELNYQLAEEQEACREKELELEEWRNQKEPEPEREEEVAANRSWLKENNIPFFPFYKVIDFAGDTNPEQRNRLEEALSCMGILDAVLVPSNYQQTVLSLREGMRDTYLFGDVNYAAQSLGELLEVSADIEDIVFYQELAGLLNSMSVNSNGKTWIDGEGRFGLGILQGTISHQYAAKFIGVKAREMYHLSKLQELEAEVRAYQEKITEITKELEGNRERIAQLEQEYQSFPSEADVREAVKDLSDLEELLQRLELARQEKEAKVKTLQKALLEIGLEAAENSKRLYLKSDLITYREAKKEAEGYLEAIAQLQLSHQAYLHSQENLRIQRDRLEDLLLELDSLRYDISKLSRESSGLHSIVRMLEEQLKEKGFEAIQQELQECMQRLEELPSELKECIQKQTKYLAYEESYGQKSLELESRCRRSECDLLLWEKGLKDEWSLNYVEEGEAFYREETKELARTILQGLSAENQRSSSDLSSQLQQKFYENLSELVDFNLTVLTVFERKDYEDYAVGNREPEFKRLSIFAKYKGREVPFHSLIQGIAGDVEIQKSLVRESDRALFEDILANTISKKIRYKIYKSEHWVEKMNRLMGSMNTSSGLKLNLVWKKKKAEEEGQLDTKDLVELLKKDAGLMREEELEQLSQHFQTKVQEARRIMEDSDQIRSFHGVMKEILDYRKWFEFQLFYQKTGENRKELTNNAFFTFSGGEKAMSMYVPLFSAVVAKYDGARPDAPRLISLDEAFAGVDEHNIRDMFRLMVDMEFEFVINSQILWGDCDTVPDLAIYQLLRKENAKYVTVLPYIWNGKVKRLVTEGDMENGE